MRTNILFLLVIAVIAALVHMPTVRADEATVAYPEGYRNWTFLHGSIVPGAFGAFSKSPCVKPCTNGMFYFYANELAMKGLRTGAYDDGAIIAEEMLEFKIGEKGVGGSKEMPMRYGFVWSESCRRRAMPAYQLTSRRSSLPWTSRARPKK